MKYFIMVENISIVSIILDIMVLLFILYLGQKKDDRTWTQKLGATMMCWFLLCHLAMSIAYGQFYEQIFLGKWYDTVAHMVLETLWKAAIIGFIVTALSTPMPLFKNVKNYKIGVIFGLSFAFLESYYTWGPPTGEDWFVYFWPFWSLAPAVLMVILSYLAWNYLTSPEGAGDRTEALTDRAGLFAVMALILWAGKNWFDWVGFFKSSEFFYTNGSPNTSTLYLVADIIGKFETGMIILPMFVLSIGSIIYLRNRGSVLLGGTILGFLILGLIHFLFFSGESQDYNNTAIFFNEEDIRESFILLTHGTMQSLARPLIILFLVVRFGMVQTEHAPNLSRAMMIMSLAGAMSVITEILQPMLGISQLISGFFLGAILAFEIERKIMQAMQPPDDEENTDWALINGEGIGLVKWTNTAFGMYIIATIILGILIAKEVII
jgi:hypothetical protein